MANIKSAKKRIKVTAKRTLRNKAIKTRTKNAIKKFLAVLANGDKTAVAAELSNTFRVIDKAASKGVYHKNNAARKKSRLALKASKIA